MATASSVSLSLIDAPHIYHEFWRSYGTSFPKGPVLTITTAVFTFLTSLITLYAAKRSLQESQYAVLLVNSNAPFDALFAAGRLTHRRGPRKTLTKIALASLFMLLLTATTPLLFARFPAFTAGLIASTDCGYFSKHPSLDGWSYLIRQQRFADAAFISLDQNGTHSTQSRGRRNLASLPSPTQSYIRQCPAGATCHPDYPFTFSSNYTLTSNNFGLNLDTSFSIQVSDTCYRPIQAHAPINPWDPENIRYCLKYGTINSTQPPEIRDCVAIVLPQQSTSLAYTVSSLSALTDPLLDRFWTPNSSLVLGGDTTILIYFVGGISYSHPSDDPMFPTKTIPNVENYYDSRYIVSPIICDTKYQLCANDGRDCSPTGPMSHVAQWIATKPGSVWASISFLFVALTYQPPILAASQGSGAIAASQTLLQGTYIQGDSEHTTVVRELSRLTTASMTMMASMSQLAALGYWNLGHGSAETLPQLCHSVVIQTPTSISILLKPYLVFLGLTLIIVGISYADVLGAGKLRVWKKYADIWALYRAGQLHREVTEQLCGKLVRAHGGESWPDLTTNRVGLDVVERDGAKYLVAANLAPSVVSESQDDVERTGDTPLLPSESQDMAERTADAPVSSSRLPAQYPHADFVSPNSPSGTSPSMQMVNHDGNEVSIIAPSPATPDTPLPFSGTPSHWSDGPDVPADTQYGPLNSRVLL